MKEKVEIVNFEPWHQPYFEKFNRAWIEAFLKMEELDKYVLTQPEDAIIKKGGAILMGLYEGEVAGTVALRKLGDKKYEFTKMAVDAKFRRKGIAEALSLAAIEKAVELGADRIILYTQSSLSLAIKLYSKIGFRQIKVETGTYERADVKMEISLKNSIPVYNP